MLRQLVMNVWDIERAVGVEAKHEVGDAFEDADR